MIRLVAILGIRSFHPLCWKSNLLGKPPVLTEDGLPDTTDSRTVSFHPVIVILFSSVGEEGYGGYGLRGEYWTQTLTFIGFDVDLFSSDICCVLGGV